MSYRRITGATGLLPCAVVAGALLWPAGAGATEPGLNGYLAYGSNRTGSTFSDDVYVTPLDTETALQLTFRRADDGQPAFSPDGRRTASKPAQSGSTPPAVMDAE